MLRTPALTVLVLSLTASASLAQENEADLAKKLSNPVSSLISVPFQSNFDCCVGPERAFKYTLNFQPVVPVSLNKDWNVIIRTILPVIYEGETQKGLGEHGGVGDITQSFFFSPKQPKGFVWGVGPAFLWPIGDSHLAGKQWAAGPTFVVLKQMGPTTVGMLANHLWTYARDRSRDEVNQTFLQPFYSYTYPSSTTISINTESSYDWAHKQWTVPFNAGVSHVYKFGDQRVQMAFQMRYFAVSADGPQWGTRFNVTLLYPEK
jgi:hypothetical protein